MSVENPGLTQCMQALQAYLVVVSRTSFRKETRVITAKRIQVVLEFVEVVKVLWMDMTEWLQSCGRFEAQTFTAKPTFFFIIFQRFQVDVRNTWSSDITSLTTNNNKRCMRVSFAILARFRRFLRSPDQEMLMSLLRSGVISGTRIFKSEHRLRVNRNNLELPTALIGATRATEVDRHAAVGRCAVAQQVICSCAK